MCHNCKEKPASVYLTQILGETMKTVDLCEGCATANSIGIAEKTDFSIVKHLLDQEPVLATE
jgi:protein-arginine kinase activator protein McsA